MRGFTSRLVTCAWVLLVPASAFAQASLAGVVRDTSGAVLPGVTVEAASPVLIEKVRTAVTDSNGRYQLVDLRPGAYAVTFTLTGFNTVRRDGITLTGSATSTVDVELRVGSLEETITVTGEAPVVDVQSTTRQAALSADVIDALPTARNYVTLARLIPGTVGGGEDVGGSETQGVGNSVSVHGSRRRRRRRSRSTTRRYRRSCRPAVSVSTSSRATAATRSATRASSPSRTARCRAATSATS